MSEGMNQEQRGIQSATLQATGTEGAVNPEKNGGAVSPAGHEAEKPTGNKISLISKETPETKKLKENAGTFALTTLIYAVFYAFCMYRNKSGVTFPFFLAGSFAYICFSLAKLGLSLKKGSSFYMVSSMLLAVATFCTDDSRIISMNKLGIFLLMICFCLNLFYHTAEWKMGKFCQAGIKLLFSTIGELGTPFAHLAHVQKLQKEKKSGKVMYVFIGLLIGLPVIVIIGVLLGSADAIFNQVLKEISLSLQIGNVIRVLFTIAFWYMVVYMLLATLCKKVISETVIDHRNGEPILAITVTGMLTVLYLFFSGIQIFGLFLGKLSLPEGYTYAKYAREGFFQLLAVSLINLVIVLGCMALFRESRILKGILLVMSLCTYIMIASSAMRMILYISSYDLTFLRIEVLWGLAVLAVIFVGVIINIFRENFPLFRYGVAVVTVCYTLLAFSHPDLWIAKYNLRPEAVASQNVDYRYLWELSADAAPVLIPYLREEGCHVEEYVRGEFPNARETWSNYREREQYEYLDLLMEHWQPGIRCFNVSRYMASRQVGGFPRK